MRAESFAKIIGADFYTGVPDSQLKALCNYLMDVYGIDERHHLIGANEGTCAALAAGYHLATGKVPVVYMQNSGEGNIVNPVASLLHEKVYAIPMIFVVGWRGEPGVHDEPQHVYQGEITLKLLEDLGIAAFVMDEQTTEAELKAVMQDFQELLSVGKNVAFVIRKGALSYAGKTEYQNDNIMKREDIIRQIVSVTGDDPVICTTGKASRELFEIREQSEADRCVPETMAVADERVPQAMTVADEHIPQAMAVADEHIPQAMTVADEHIPQAMTVPDEHIPQAMTVPDLSVEAAAGRSCHRHDFLTVGSMGHSSSIALGIAVNQPDKKVWCIDGDGAALMHMGAMAVIGNVKPVNFVHVIINNESHETVGGMPTAAGGVDFVALAKACGYPYAVRVDSPAALADVLAAAKARQALCMIEVKAAIGARKDLGRPTTTALENKRCFMNYLNRE